MAKCLVINSKDNVAVALTSQRQVPKGHKIALKPIKANSPIVKFGQVIGLSKKAIARGEHVHVDNMYFDEKIEFSAKKAQASKDYIFSQNKELPVSFKGFLRKDGRAGIRNYILVVSTVNCSATVVRQIADYFRKKKLTQIGIDRVVPIIHGSGCAQKRNGYAHILLKRTISGWLNHPNVVGAVVVGLGCEVLTPEDLISGFNPKNKLPLEFFNIQDSGGTRKSIKLGIEKVEKVLSSLPIFERKELPVSLLKVALKCGGSDSYSSLTANPALGVASDILVRQGGTVVLGEIPESYGALKLLIKRCRSKSDKAKLRMIFSWWEDYADRNNVSINDNLSLGNIKGGISTILEKSLGAIAKCGSFAISQVLDYAEPVTKKGIVLMNTPGFDPVSVTGLVAGGCNLLAFTTGRGSVYGCSIAPTIKIATNYEIYRKLKDDIDINAARVLEEKSLLGVGQEIYKSFIKVASGERTQSEKQNLGNDEFVPWQVGEVL